MNVTQASLLTSSQHQLLLMHMVSKAFLVGVKLSIRDESVYEKLMFSIRTSLLRPFSTPGEFLPSFVVLAV